MIFMYNRPMDTWTTPEFVEIKMDAEIGSYQEDRDPLEEGPDRVSDDAE